MPHETALILTIAGGIGLAFVLGLAVTRVRLLGAIITSTKGPRHG